MTLDQDMQLRDTSSLVGHTIKAVIANTGGKRQVSLVIVTETGCWLALDAKAWDMAGEAFTIAREHLERKVSHRAEVGLPLAVNTRLALKAIAATTLGNALTHAHSREMQQTLKMMRLTADIHRAAIAKAEHHMQALGITPEA